MAGTKKPAASTQTEAATEKQEGCFIDNPEAISLEQVEDLIESVAGDNTEEPEEPTQPEELVQSKYPTEFYRNNNIPYCETCGERYLSNADNTPFCPEKRSKCPRL